MNRYTDYGNTQRRPGQPVTSKYALPPSYSVGELPTPSTPAYTPQRTSAGVQARWEGEKPNFMTFPTLQAISGALAGGRKQYLGDKEKEQEKAEKEREKAEREERRTNRTTTVVRGGPPKQVPTKPTKPNDQPVDDMNDPGAPPRPPGYIDQNHSDMYITPPAPISSTNQRRFSSTRGKGYPGMESSTSTPWQQKQERTGYMTPGAPANPASNRGPAPTTNKGVPLLGPRNRRKR